MALGNVKVYIDDDGIIYDASLNQTNIGGNNNKVCKPPNAASTKSDV